MRRVFNVVSSRDPVNCLRNLPLPFNFYRVSFIPTIRFLMVDDKGSWLRLPDESSIIVKKFPAGLFPISNIIFSWILLRRFRGIVYRGLTARLSLSVIAVTIINGYAIRRMKFLTARSDDCNKWELRREIYRDKVLILTGDRTWWCGGSSQRLSDKSFLPYRIMLFHARLLFGPGKIEKLSLYIFVLTVRWSETVEPSVRLWKKLRASLIIILSRAIQWGVPSECLRSCEGGDDVGL